MPKIMNHCVDWYVCIDIDFVECAGFYSFDEVEKYRDQRRGRIIRRGNFCLID